jgi:hypothetical protein
VQGQKDEAAEQRRGKGGEECKEERGIRRRGV